MIYQRKQKSSKHKINLFIILILVFLVFLLSILDFSKWIIRFFEFSLILFGIRTIFKYKNEYYKIEINEKIIFFSHNEKKSVEYNIEKVKIDDYDKYLKINDGKKLIILDKACWDKELLDYFKNLNYSKQKSNYSNLVFISWILDFVSSLFD